MSLVFERGFDSLDKALDVCLDDFVRNQTTIFEVPELKELSVCVSAPSRFPRKWLRWYYKQAMNNLMKTAPNLRNLELNGGFVYLPRNPVDR